MNPGTFNWRLPQADMTAGWGEIAEYVLGICKGAGKTIAGQEGAVVSARTRHDVVLEEIEGVDTDEQRKGPTCAWRWRLTLALSYPGRQKGGTSADSLDDAEGIAKLLTTANPGRGWRIHVRGVRGRVERDHFRVRILVEVTAAWHAGDAEGLAPDSAEALASAGRP